MTPLIFVQRCWDDLTNVFLTDRFRLPLAMHSPLTAAEMTEKLHNPINELFINEGFELVDELTWVRPHPLIGFDICKLDTVSKYSPEFFSVNILVGFEVPLLIDAIDKVCDVKAPDTTKRLRPFTLHLLHRAYLDPNRPKKRLPFDRSFMLFNIDFRDSVIRNIRETIRDFVFPYFSRVESLADLEKIETQALDHRVALLVYLKKVDSAFVILDSVLHLSSRYIPEMKDRFRRLRQSIETGELQKLLIAPVDL
jgi:hypothetical protein